MSRAIDIDIGIENKIDATDEEIQALKNYIKGGHHLDFNKRLRENKRLTEQQAEQYKHLYDIIDRNRITEDMTVYRGIKTTEKKFINSLGINRSFTSTSKSKSFSPGKECCQLIIHLKKGDRAIDVSENYNKHEQEVLIAPGIFNVIKRYVKDVIYEIKHIDMSSIVPKVTYQERVEPTLFYELSYENHDEKLYSFSFLKKKKNKKRSKKLKNKK